METHLLASLGSKGKNRNSLACRGLRNAGSPARAAHSAAAESYCIRESLIRRTGRRPVTIRHPVTGMEKRKRKEKPLLIVGRKDSLDDAVVDVRVLVMRARQAASFARCCIATCAIFAPLLAYAAVPAAPDDVAVNFVTRNEISLSWTAPVGARRYKADYRRAGSGAYESYGPGATFTLPKLMVGMLLVNVSRPYLFESPI